MLVITGRILTGAPRRKLNITIKKEFLGRKILQLKVGSQEE
jgi:hypothetical protein